MLERTVNGFGLRAAPMFGGTAIVQWGKTAIVASVERVDEDGTVWLTADIWPEPRRATRGEFIYTLDTGEGMLFCNQFDLGWELKRD